MNKLHEKLIKSDKKFKGRLLGFKVDTVETASGSHVTREVVEHPGAVAIIAITQEKELVLVRQFRYATGGVLLEIPAGVPKKGESPEDCAARELEEETGFRAEKIKKLWEGYSSPGYSNEILYFCLAEDLTQFKQNTDEDEFIEVDLVDIEACMDMLKNGRIMDNKTMVGIMIADMFVKGEL